MNIDDTYNIHKKINCVFPHFKSEKLCKKGKHNYQLHSKIIKKGNDIIWKTYWQCYCCGKKMKYID